MSSSEDLIESNGIDTKINEAIDLSLELGAIYSISRRVLADGSVIWGERAHAFHAIGGDPRPEAASRALSVVIDRYQARMHRLLRARVIAAGGCLYGPAGADAFSNVLAVQEADCRSRT